MKILPVTSPEFKPYGRIVEGCAVEGILAALATRPLPDGVAYVPNDDVMAAAEGASAIGDTLFGDMPYQLGW